MYNVVFQNPKVLLFSKTQEYMDRLCLLCEPNLTITHTYGDCNFLQIFTVLLDFLARDRSFLRPFLALLSNILGFITVISDPKFIGGLKAL